MNNFYLPNYDMMRLGELFNLTMNMYDNELFKNMYNINQILEIMIMKQILFLLA